MSESTLSLAVSLLVVVTLFFKIIEAVLRIRWRRASMRGFRAMERIGGGRR